MKLIQKPLRRFRVSTLLLFDLILLCAVLVPQMFSGYTLKVINLSLLYGIMVLSTVIVLGMGGQMSMANVAMFGLGAYVTANLCSGHLGIKNFNTVLALVISIVGVGLVSFLLGLLLERLDGTFFTFATIGVVQVCAAFFSQYRPLFGGPDGISGVAKLELFGFKVENYKNWFYVLVFFLLVVGAFTARLKKTKFGRSLFCIRDNKTAAVTLGVNVFMTRVYAFTIQGIICGLCGALYAFMNGYVGSTMFTFTKATDMMMMTMIGGLNSIAGSVFGSFVVTVLPETLRSLQSYLRLIFGVIVVLLMIFMPTGLAGLASSTAEKARRGLRKAKEKKSEARQP